MTGTPAGVGAGGDRRRARLLGRRPCHAGARSGQGGVNLAARPSPRSARPRIGEAASGARIVDLLAAPLSPAMVAAGPGARPVRCRPGRPSRSHHAIARRSRRRRRSSTTAAAPGSGPFGEIMALGLPVARHRGYDHRRPVRDSRADLASALPAVLPGAQHPRRRKPRPRRDRRRRIARGRSGPRERLCRVRTRTRSWSSRRSTLPTR